MKNNRIKQRLKNGEKLNGCWIEMYHPVATEIVGRAGYDIAFIDLEHGPGTYMDVIQSMQAISDQPCAAMVRVGSSDIVDIKRTLDIGPEGIMVPNVRNKEEAERVVAACRYGPEGIRGAAPGIIRATNYGSNTEDYSERMENHFLLIAQIETLEGLENVDAIANTDGIDMLFIGPSDLSASLGDPGNVHSEIFKEAYTTIINAGKSADKSLGVVPMPGYTNSQLYQDGIDLILCGCDTMLLKAASEQDVESIRESAN